MKNLIRLAKLLVVGLVLSSSAYADDDGWGFEFVPYLWGAGIDADVSAGNRTADVDVAFEDVFDALEIGGSFLSAVRYNDWILWTQLDYLELDTDNLDDAPSRSRLESDSLFLTAALGYRFPTFGEHSSIDVLGGVRYLDLENTITIDGLGSGTGTQDVTDAIFMVRPRFQLIDWLYFNPTLSVGAGDSDLTYELQPQFEFLLTDVLVARLGYRRLYYDVDGSRGNNFDGSFEGLIAGVGFSF